jgi:transposase InsO family protein
MTTSSTRPPRRCGPLGSTRDSTCAANQRCTGSCASTAKSGNAGPRPPTRPPSKPELVATAPGQIYSWDITKLHGPDRGEYYHLYVMLDIFSRYVVGWTVAAAESANLATAFIADITAIHGAPQAIHADRGTSMTSKPVAQLLLDLGVARSHSRPRVSNDCDDCLTPPRAGSDPSQRPAPVPSG